MSESFMQSHLSTILVGGTAFVLAIYLMRRRKSAGNIPPGPRGVPLYGNSLEISKWEVNGPGIFDKWAKEFGDIYSISMGSYPAVVFNSLETIKEAYIKHGDKTSGRFTNIFFYKYVLRIAKLGVAVNEGQEWKTIRRTVIHSLRDFGMGKKSLEHKIQEEARALVDHLDSIGEGPHDLRIALHNVYTNIIVSIIFGERYEYNDPEFQNMSNLLYRTMLGAGMKNLEVFVPVLTLLLPFTNPGLFKLFKVNTELHKCLNNAIQRQRVKFDPDDIHSFIDIYLKAERDGEFNDARAEKNLFMTIFDLFLAGSETGTTTTRWAILYFLHHPDVQKKCQQVIKEAIGQEKIPTSEDRAKLLYVDATIHEIQRLANIAPAGPMHRAEETFEMAGYTIPKDTLLIANLHAVHKDTRYWKDPERFDPERWIGPDGKLIKHESFLPFGTGPRECLGRNLALQELFIVLVSLLQKFTFKPKDPENLPKLAGSVGLVHLPNVYDVILEKW